ncbi:hypothetical protein OIO90_000700 [Microbotryomycetes sp. JL221]|nr:hypothetical protein OIO90_000700 [Microbotryomycetes sp. JL221]
MSLTQSSSDRHTSNKRKSAMPAGAPPLGKFLASSEKHIRDKAVAALAKFLRGKQKAAFEQQGDDDDITLTDDDWSHEWIPDSRLQDSEMAKLWKGVFFCFWMSDKPLVQQALAADLSSLVLEVRPSKPKDSSSVHPRVARFRAAMCYLRGFWWATTREWSSLDRLRLDKFYLLIRRFVNVAFRLLERELWDLHAIREYNALLTGPNGPLDVLNQRVPDSLAYHLSDIYIDELNKVCESESASSSQTHNVPVVALLDPFLTTLAISPTSTLYTRVNDNVFKPLLDETLPELDNVGPRKKKRRTVVGTDAQEAKYQAIYERSIEGRVSERQQTDDVEPATIRKQFGVKLLQAVFDKGGQGDTTDVNRRRMYKLVKEKEDASGVEL